LPNFSCPLFDLSLKEPIAPPAALGQLHQICVVFGSPEPRKPLKLSVEVKPGHRAFAYLLAFDRMNVE
jgi:hypothetical protein